jgi:hypothetical protein
MTDELSELRARIAELERAKPAPMPDEAAAAKWRNEMHQAAENRMARANAFSHEDLRAMEAATPADTCRDLWQHGRTPGPSAAGTSGMITKVSSNAGLPGSNTGWRTAPAIGLPPGVAIADRLMDAQDARDRAELVERHARMQAMQKLAEPK